MYSLMGNLSEGELLRVLSDYESNKEKRRYQSAIDLILRANRVLAERVVGMSEVLDELLADKYREREAHGERRKLMSIVDKMLVKGRELTEIAELLGEEYSVIQSCAQELQQAVH